MEAPNITQRPLPFVWKLIKGYLFGFDCAPIFKHHGKQLRLGWLHQIHKRKVAMV
jgi:hypothetical protein